VNYREYIKGITAGEVITISAFEQLQIYRKNDRITDAEHEQVNSVISSMLSLSLGSVVGCLRPCVDTVVQFLSLALGPFLLSTPLLCIRLLRIWAGRWLSLRV